MKTGLLVTLFFMTLSSLFAEDIDMKMQKIREAPPKERVKLMNSLKREIAAMNKQERDEAIHKLQLQTKSKTSSRENVNKEQFQQVREAQQVQRRNQQQAAKQYMQNTDQTQMRMTR